MGKRIIQAEIMITCEVLIDDEIKSRVAEQYSNVSDQELARQMLYAFFKSQLPVNIDLENAEGSWDAICDFRGKFSNFKIRKSTE